MAQRFQDAESLELTKLLKNAASSSLDKGDVVHLMVLLRVLLERNALKTQYSILTLYCDWSVHPNLDRSVVCIQMLENLTDVLLRQKTPPPELSFKYATPESYANALIDMLHTDVNTALAIGRLNKELLDFCLQFNLLDTVFSDTEMWKRTLGVLLSNLIDRPLEFPAEIKGQVKRIHESIQQKVGGDRKCEVSRFSFVLLGDGDVAFLRDRYKKIPFLKNSGITRFIFWKIETSGFVDIIGPLKFV